MPAAPVSQVHSIENLYGPAGRLEALLNTGHDNPSFTALVCHPHPPSGGTMHTKVVYHAAKVFTAMGIPVLRFNFRGVGLSEGVYDDGHGEQNDVRAALQWLEHNFRKPILFAGFSFGANVGLRACCGDLRVRGLVGLGVPICAEGRDYAYNFLPRCEAPKLFVIGGDDPFSPREPMEALFRTTPEPRNLVWIEGADHFFQGTPHSPRPKLDDMKHAMRTWLTKTYGL